MRWSLDTNHWLNICKWVGTATGGVGALLMALNIGAVDFGFVLFAISSALWTYAGWVHRDWSLVALQGVFLLIDVVGIFNWFGA